MPANGADDSPDDSEKRPGAFSPSSPSPSSADEGATGNRGGEAGRRRRTTTGPASESREFYHAVSELQRLGKIKPVRGENKQRATEVMTYLRQKGFTISEIVALSGNAWDYDNIKKGTRGAKKKDSTLHDNLMDLLLKMHAMRITPERASEAVSTIISLLGNKVTVPEISAFIRQCREIGLTTDDIAATIRQLNVLGADISAEDQPAIELLRELLAYKQELGKLGYGTNDLVKIIAAAAKFGKPQDLLDALNKAGTIQVIQRDIAQYLQKREELEEAINRDLPEQIAELEKKRDRLKEPIRIYYEVLKPNGYDESVLTDIADLAKIHLSARGKEQRGGRANGDRDSESGGIIHQVMDAVKNYVRLEELELDVADLEQRRDRIQVDFDALKNEKAHMVTVNQMSDMLLSELGFSMSGIRELVSLAKKYGSSPFEVFNALSEYGKTTRLEERIDSLEASIAAKLQERDALEKHLVSLRAQTGHLDLLVQSAIEPMKEAYISGANELKSVYEAELQSLQRESVKSAEKIAAEKMFEEELSMARLVAGISRYPTQLVELPIDAALTLLDAVIRFCIVRADPTIPLRVLAERGLVLMNPEMPIKASVLLTQARLMLTPSGGRVK